MKKALFFISDFTDMAFFNIIYFDFIWGTWIIRINMDEIETDPHSNTFGWILQSLKKEKIQHTIFN